MLIGIAILNAASSSIPTLLTFIAINAPNDPPIANITDNSSTIEIPPQCSSSKHFLIKNARKDIRFIAINIQMAFPIYTSLSCDYDLIIIFIICKNLL